MSSWDHRRKAAPDDITGAEWQPGDDITGAGGKHGDDITGAGGHDGDSEALVTALPSSALCCPLSPLG